MLFNKLVLLIVISFLSKSFSEGNIVEELTKRFYDVSDNCLDAQNEAQPIYKCSGIIIRGYKSYSNETKFAWSLKAADIEKNSFPFGYLRQDFPFTRFGKGYDAGFILYPHFSTPEHKTTQEVLCAFPIDARTDMRADRGCGQRRGDENGTSRQCEAQNIITYSQWLSFYEKIMSGERPQFEVSQCGFALTDEATAVRNFAVVREANIHLQSNPRFALVNSELRLVGWDENNAKEIPIQAFFYFIDSEKGYENAVKYQNDFCKESGGENVPIVGIRLPSTSNPNIYIEDSSVNNELRNILN